MSTATPPTVNQRAQLAVEALPGGGGAATQQLAGVMFTETPKINTSQIRRQGHAYPSASVRGQGYSDLALSSDYCCFNSVTYLLAGLLGLVSPTLHSGGTLSMDWPFVAKLIDCAVGQTYALERGQSGTGMARKYDYVGIDALTLSGTKDKMSISSGHAWAREIQEDVTLTASVPELACVPISGINANVYLDTTSGGIGGTLLDLSEWSLAFSNFSSPRYNCDRSQVSYSELVPGVPSILMTFKVKANQDAWDFFNYLRTGELVYPQLNITGPIIEAAIPHALIFNAAAFVTSNDGFGDDQAVDGLVFTGTIGEDPAFGVNGTSLTGTVTNKLTTL